MHKLVKHLTEKVGSKGCRLFLFVAALASALLVSRPALAQKQDFYQLYLSLHGPNNSYDNQATAGRDNRFFLDVRNTGNAQITNIMLSSEAPAGWTVTITPATISHLNAGSLQTVDVNIKPVDGPTTQSDTVTFIAQANEIANVKSSFSITVKPASFWVWVWVGVIAVIAAIFVGVYLKFGRQ